MSVRIPTEAEARAMWQAIQDFQKKDADAQKAIHDANMATAQAWYDGLGINIDTSTTRTKALQIVRQIEGLIETETDRYRKSILRNQRDIAEKKYIDVKKVNPNS